MPGVNKMIIVGNIGTDIEVRHTNQGTPVVNMRVAVSDHKDETEWFSCVAFDKKAETLGAYGRKGGQIYIEGRVRSREWEGKDGVLRKDKEVIINNFQLLGSRPKEEEQPRSYNQYSNNEGGYRDRDPAPPF